MSTAVVEGLNSRPVVRGVEGSKQAAAPARQGCAPPRVSTRNACRHLTIDWDQLVGLFTLATLAGGSLVVAFLDSTERDEG
jgi:hypothetical protein